MVLIVISCFNKHIVSYFVDRLLFFSRPLQHFWVLACSTVVEYSQQEGFTECRCQQHVKPPNLEDQWLERSNSRHKVSPTSETMRANPSSGRWKYGLEIAENFAESGDFHVTFGLFYVPWIYDMGPTPLLPLRRKVRWGIFRPRTWVPKASTLTSRPPKPLLLTVHLCIIL